MKSRSSRLGIARGKALSKLSPSPALSDGSPRLPLHSDDYFYVLIPHFMSVIHPFCPVVNEQEIQDHIHGRHSDDVSATFIHAWAALVLFVLRFTEDRSSSQRYNEVSLLANGALKYLQRVKEGSYTLERLLATLFTSWSMLILHNLESGFYYMQQATSLVHILQMRQYSQPLDTRLRTIYWMCLVHERSLAILFKTPICLEPLPALPDDQWLKNIGLCFTLLDRPFLSAWKSEHRTCLDRCWIEQRHRALMDDAWFEEVEQLPLVQQLDLMITRQWLCTLLWQMAISSVQLSSETVPSNALTLTLPLHILEKLRSLLDRTSPSEAAIHAFSLVGKLFEILTTISDVLCLQPLHKETATNKARVNDFLFAKDFLLQLPGVELALRNALTERVQKVTARYKQFV